jgi:hypothetical protein
MSGLMSNSGSCPSRCMARCDTRTRVSASASRSGSGRPRKPPEQPGSFDLGDHRLCFRARIRAAAQGHIVGDLDQHAAAAEQEHRAQLRVAIDANDDFYTFSYHLLHRHAGDPSLWSYRSCRIYSLPPRWGRAGVGVNSPPGPQMDCHRHDHPLPTLYP